MEVHSEDRLTTQLRAACDRPMQLVGAIWPITPYYENVRAGRWQSRQSGRGMISVRPFPTTLPPR